MPEDPNPSASKEREFETGTDEFFKAHSELTATNAKRTYDAYQHAELSQIHTNQVLFQQSAASLQNQLAQINQLTIQHLQNAIQTTHQVSQSAVATMDMTGKQAVKHADVAADALWNPIQQGSGDNLTAGSVTANRAVDTATAGIAVDASAVQAAVAKSVDATVVPLISTLIENTAALGKAIAALLAAQAK